MASSQSLREATGVVDDLARRIRPPLHPAHEPAIELAESLGLVAAQRRATALALIGHGRLPRVCGQEPTAPGSYVSPVA